MRIYQLQESNFILVITLHAMLHKYTHTQKEEKRKIYVYPAKQA
jgi:hypothetical protein